MRLAAHFKTMIVFCQYLWNYSLLTLMKHIDGKLLTSATSQCSIHAAIATIQPYLHGGIVVGHSGRLAHPSAGVT